MTSSRESRGIPPRFRRRDESRGVESAGIQSRDSAAPLTAAGLTAAGLNRELCSSADTPIPPSAPRQPRPASARTSGVGLLNGERRLDLTRNEIPGRRCSNCPAVTEPDRARSNQPAPGRPPIPPPTTAEVASGWHRSPAPSNSRPLPAPPRTESPRVDGCSMVVPHSIRKESQPARRARGSADRRSPPHPAIPANSPPGAVPAEEGHMGPGRRPQPRMTARINPETNP